jgi:hypothetical protein
MGAFGGTLAALSVIFSGFTSVTDVPSSKSRRARNDRAAFFFTRIVFGSGLGLLVTLWFMDSFLAREISTSKLAFVQGVSGYASSFLKEGLDKSILDLPVHAASGAGPDAASTNQALACLIREPAIPGRRKL